jgi:hypothetical protein
VDRSSGIVRKLAQVLQAYRMTSKEFEGGGGVTPVTVFLKKKNTGSTKTLFVGGDGDELFTDVCFSWGRGGGGVGN